MTKRKETEINFQMTLTEKKKKSQKRLGIDQKVRNTDKHVCNTLSSAYTFLVHWDQTLIKRILLALSQALVLINSFN